MIYSKPIENYTFLELIELLTVAAVDIMRLQSERDKALIELKDANKFREDFTKSLRERPSNRQVYYHPRKNPLY